MKHFKSPSPETIEPAIESLLEQLNAAANEYEIAQWEHDDDPALSSYFCGGMVALCWATSIIEHMFYETEES